MIESTFSQALNIHLQHSPERSSVHTTLGSRAQQLQQGSVSEESWALFMAMPLTFWGTSGPDSPIGYQHIVKCLHARLQVASGEFMHGL